MSILLYFSSLERSLLTAKHKSYESLNNRATAGFCAGILIFSSRLIEVQSSMTWQAELGMVMAVQEDRLNFNYGNDIKKFMKISFSTALE